MVYRYSRGLYSGGSVGVWTANCKILNI
jgi:hypothetical protein